MIENEDKVFDWILFTIAAVFIATPMALLFLYSIWWLLTGWEGPYYG